MPGSGLLHRKSWLCCVPASLCSFRVCHVTSWRNTNQDWDSCIHASDTLRWGDSPKCRYRRSVSFPSRGTRVSRNPRRFLNLVPGGCPQLHILNVSFVRHTFHVISYIICKIGLQKCVPFDQKCLVSERHRVFSYISEISVFIICALFSYTVHHQLLWNTAVLKTCLNKTKVVKQELGLQHYY